MIDSAFLDYLRLLHGSFNAIIALLFIYHGSLGWRIRKERKRGGERNLKVIRRHRKEGPIFAVLGVAGYLAGVGLILIDKGHLFEYPSHMIIGSCIALLIITTFIISKKIKGLESFWRTPHFMIGLFILLLYVIQIYLGLGILL
jgi:uncharacterized iron-regulated membrane protein